MMGELVSITAPLDDLVDLSAHIPARAGYAWLRSGEGIVGWGEAARVEVVTGSERFARAVADLQGVWDRLEIGSQSVGPGPVAFGSFTFDPEAPGSVLVVPEVQLRVQDGRSWITLVGTGTRPDLNVLAVSESSDRVRYLGSTESEIAWLEAVDKAIDLVAGDRLDKVVLARDLLVWSRAPFDERVVCSRLAARFDACYTFACAGLVGASPELLVRRQGLDIESIPLAGSARRGTTPEEDDTIGRELFESPKERNEHALAVATVRDALAHLCDRLEADADPFLLRLANVQHLATHVRGRLREPAGALEVAGALHPTAAVCGVPTEDALDVIRSLEGIERGRYTGPVGWVDAAGDGEWAIALRCAEIDRTRARLFAGNGIVDGSVPEAELEETRLKLRAMQEALDPTR